MIKGEEPLTDDLLREIAGDARYFPMMRRLAQELLALRLAAGAVVAHWNEFGPECGLDETIDRLDKQRRNPNTC